MPEHGIADDLAEHQSKLAVESRAYPLIRYNPDKGTLPEECFDLKAIRRSITDWPTYKLEYTDEQGNKDKMELPLTFADFAVTEGRFRKQFRTVPRDAWNDNMVRCHEYLDLAEDDREGKFPYIWAVNQKNRLIRVIPAEPLVRSCEDRRNFWRMLKSLAGLKPAMATESAERIRAEFARTLAARLMEMVANGTLLGDVPASTATTGPVAALPAAALPVAAATPAEPAKTNGYVAPWIESELCTSCNECVGINAKIFAYDADQHAFVKDPKGGPYKDLVRAAEKCTAQVIHPGTPSDPNEKDAAKLLARAAKYN
jgi:pyruvate-ferredoxin/flavodoxin oxidoreductase